MRSSECTTTQKDHRTCQHIDGPTSFTVAKSPATDKLPLTDPDQQATDVSNDMIS